MPVTRNTGEILHAERDATLEGIRKIAVGRVTRVNGQRCDIQLSVNTPLVDEFGQVTFEAAPVLGDVPIGTIRGGGYLIWVPVAAGDSVLVVFTDLSTDTWRASDGSKPVSPGFVGRHTADSCFAIPMIAPDSQALSSADSTKLIIGKDGSSALIKISASEIDLGANATDAVGLAHVIDTAVSTIITAFNSHTHTVPIVGAAGTTPSTPPLASIPGQPGTGSALVKVQP
jgi:Phage protein Gp138 N-terminal domain